MKRITYLTVFFSLLLLASKCPDQDPSGGHNGNGQFNYNNQTTDPTDLQIDSLYKTTPAGGSCEEYYVKVALGTGEGYMSSHSTPLSASSTQTENLVVFVQSDPTNTQPSFHEIRVCDCGDIIGLDSNLYLTIKNPDGSKKRVASVKYSDATNHKGSTD